MQKRLTLSAFARKTGTTADTVRHYLRTGLLQPARDPSNRYRLFTPRDMTRIRFIRQAKELGYTLSEIRQIFEDSARGDSPCPRVREIIQRRIVENRRRLTELERLQTRMEEALKKWEDMSDGVPDGESVCHLIESASAADETDAPPAMN